MKGTTMTRPATRALLALAAAGAAAAIATGPARAADAPTEGVAPSCAQQCVQFVRVAPTTGSARIEIVTSVRTRVAVTARRLTNTGGLTTGAPDAAATGGLLATVRALPLRGLQPATTYRLVVTATDKGGRSSSRTLTFETKAVQTAGQPTVGGVTAGLGCSARCITKAVPVHIGPTAALFEVATSTPATITSIVSQAGSIRSIASSEAGSTSYRHAASPLHPGTTYDLSVRATDAAGRTEHHWFTFRTVERKARVTLSKITVIDDGDRGADRGELSFELWLGGTMVGRTGWAKRSSGDTFAPVGRGTSRPGITGTTAVNGASPKLDLFVKGEDCDGVLLMKNCNSEVVAGLEGPGGKNGSGYDYATAGGAFGLGALLGHGALRGSDATLLPPGHDGYLVFETTKYALKFRAYAYVDFFYAW